MDIVYVCKKSWGHENELRFSLRSAERNLKFDKVFIFGHKASFLNDKVIHVSGGDTSKDKFVNVARKISMIVDDQRISDDFIYMNDDFFILKEYPTIPYYCNKSIRAWVDSTDTKESFKGTKWHQNIHDLYKTFPEGMFFETHFPIVYNKQLLKDVIEKYGISQSSTIRSHYCNEYKDRLEFEETEDHKIYNPEELKELKTYKEFLSTTDLMANHSLFKGFMGSRFSTPSSYEVVKIINK